MTGGNLADLNIRITSNLAQIQGSLGGIQGQLNTLGSRMKSALNFTAVSLGLTGIVSTLKELVSIGVKYDANMEQTKIAFDRLFGKDSQKMLQDITSLAEATPFEFPELADAAARLKAFNFEASAIPSILIAAGDASSAMGKGTEGMNRIITALSQIQAKGKVSAEEMNQLAEVGINGFKYIADSMGISEAKARQMAEKGLIPVNKALKEIVIAMERDFGGMMDKQSKSAIGLWSTLKDNIKSTLGELTIGILNRAKPAMESLINTLKNFKSGLQVGGLAQAMYNIVPESLFVKFYMIYEAISHIYAVAKPIAEGVAQGFSKAVLNIYEQFLWLSDKGGSVLSKLGVNISGGDLKQTSSTIAEWAITLFVVSKTLGFIGGLISGLVRGMQAVGNIWSWFHNIGLLISTNVIPRIIVLFGTLGLAIQSAWFALMSGLGAGALFLGEKILYYLMLPFVRIIQFIPVAFSTVIGGITATIMGLPAWIVGLLAAAAFAIGALIGLLLRTTGEWIYNWITGGAKSWIDTWNTNVDNTLGLFKYMWDSVKEYASSALSWITSKWESFAKWLGSIFSTAESASNKITSKYVENPNTVPYSIEQLTGRAPMPGESNIDYEIRKLKAGMSIDLGDIETPEFDPEKLAKAFKGLGDNIEPGTTALKKMQDTLKDVIDEIKNAADGIVTFGSAFDKVSYDRFSPAKLVNRVKRFFEEISKWTKNLDILASRGVDQNILNQLRGMGIQGYGITAGLAQANEAQLAQITSLYGQSRAMAVGVASDKVQVEHMGTITVKGVNDAGQLKAVVELVAKDINANASKYTSTPSINNMFK